MSYLPDSVLQHLRTVADLPDLTGLPYELRGELGRGGMGTVYRVWDQRLGRFAALKVLRRGGEAEAALMANLEHPGIIPVYDAGQLADGRGFYVMRLVEGEPLDSRNAPLPERLQLMERICEAVAFAHSRGVIHRDLKPDNIRLGRFGEVWVLDWGVARSQQAEEIPSVVGTPRYMAPEQAEGRSHQADARSDVFSLGEILKHLAGPQLPRPVASIARRATAPHPADRYTSVEQMLDDIRRYLNGEAVQAHHESVPEKILRFIRNNQVLLLLLAVYLAVKFFLFFLRRS